MRIRLTHTFTDRQLRAIARACGARKKRKATRTECIQFVSQALDAAKTDALELLARFEVSSDPKQLTLADAREAVGT